ncbi:MAG TPA: alpha-ketoacid dehydrogenase subunit beta [Candidatus Methylomirabilis sp.]|nr:alpha-ketoacid dehydrogenase subunit beta [Candidatus Methylomirabilis sp.]
MRKMTMAEALREALIEEMTRDPRVFLIGEDLRAGVPFGVTKGLAEQFGEDRVLDTPISEAAIIGASLGAAITGMRPVADMHFADFVTCAMDEVVNQIAKVRYMFGGQVDVPLVLRMPTGSVKGAAAHHSQSLEAWFVHTPGLRVVFPSTPADAMGLLKTCIRSLDPVLFFEHKRLYKVSGEVPEEEYLIPLGEADVKRTGSDVSVIATGWMVHQALEAADRLSQDGISAEVVDPRCLAPFDQETVFASVRKTNRVVIVEEAAKTGAFGAQVAAWIAEEIFDHLDAPVCRVAARDVPIPFSPPLAAHALPQVGDIVAAIRKVFRQ